MLYGASTFLTQARVLKELNVKAKMDVSWKPYAASEGFLQIQFAWSLQDVGIKVGRKQGSRKT